MLQAEEPLAIPLWINGHAYLTMTPGFLDVRNPLGGDVLRRTPLCGPGEARQAVAAAQAALSAWAAQPGTARATLLAAAGDALAGYADHFARLIVEETGVERHLADDEVAAAVVLLRTATAGDASGVVGVVGAAGAALYAPLSLAVPVLSAGGVVVIRPHPAAPAALFALAELTGRCGFPGGVFNILHGGDEAMNGLREATGGKLLCA